MSTRSLRYALGAGIVLLLLLPFLVLIRFASSWQIAASKEISEVFLFTSLQAFLSASASMMAGILGGLGLIWASRLGAKRARALEALVLLPNVAPVLLVILATLKVFPGLQGLLGIVLIHTLLNAGLVAVVFVRLVKDKISGMAELAWIEGASGWRFFRRGVLPYLRTDLLTVALFVFALCFSSFATPLIVGGSRATTLEVLIYQKIRITADWSGAIGVAVLQMLSILVLSWGLRRDTGTTFAARGADTPLLAWKWGLVPALLPAGLLAWGLIDGWSRGASQLASMGIWSRDIPRLALGSLIVGLGTGVTVVFLLLLIAFVYPSGLFRRFMVGYVAPSTVLMGFALLVAWRAMGLASYLKIILGLSLIMVPSFYRLQWDSTLRSLQGQRDVARVLGAGDVLIFVRVLLPQVVRPAFFIAGVASLWAWGDFALSAVVAERDLTIAMLVQSLMESYRLDAATVLVWTVIAGGALSFLLFNGVGRVIGTKPQA